MDLGKVYSLANSEMVSSEWVKAQIGCLACSWVGVPKENGHHVPFLENPSMEAEVLQQRTIMHCSKHSVCMTWGPSGG